MDQLEELELDLWEHRSYVAGCEAIARIVDSLKTGNRYDEDNFLQGIADHIDDIALAIRARRSQAHRLEAC